MFFVRFGGPGYGAHKVQLENPVCITMVRMKIRQKLPRKNGIIVVSSIYTVTKAKQKEALLWKIAVLGMEKPPVCA